MTWGNGPVRATLGAAFLAGALAGVVLTIYIFHQEMEKSRLTGLLWSQKAGLLEVNEALLKHRIEQMSKISANGIQANGPLRVQGDRLLNRQGNPVQLRGMSSHGLMWYPEYINARALADLKMRGANLFRAAMYADSHNGGYNENEQSRMLNKLFLFMAVENTLANDMYVIIDWHLLKDENPLKTVDEAVEFFAELSYRYQGEPGVIYEICNEPNGDTTWEDITAYAARVIPAIRKNAPEAVVLVGTPRFSSDLESARQAPLPYENIMYTYHMYTGQSDHEYEKELGAMAEADLPVFVSEWGLSTDEKTGRLDVEEALDFIAYLKRHGISWANWSLSNKAEDFSAIKSDVVAFSGWTDDDLTLSGRIVFKALGDAAP